MFCLTAANVKYHWQYLLSFTYTSWLTRPPDCRVTGITDFHGGKTASFITFDTAAVIPYNIKPLSSACTPCSTVHIVCGAAYTRVPVVMFMEIEHKQL